MNDNIDLFSNGLINIILKVNLFDELDEKDLTHTTLILF